MDKIYGMRYDYNFPFNISHVCEISIFFFLLLNGWSRRVDFWIMIKIGFDSIYVGDGVVMR